ncbi:MAG: segregation and condensation protein A [Sulfobacillus sp.]
MSVDFAVDDEVYQGPLHLLLALAERGEVDLRRLSLARVCDRYLEAVRQLSPFPLNDAGHFLYMGARLIRLKLAEASGDDDGEVEQLQAELEVLAQLERSAQWLSARQDQQTFGRPRPMRQVGGTADSLRAAMVRLARRNRQAPPLRRRTREVPLDALLSRWRSRLQATGEDRYRSLDWPWGVRGAALLALLEMARRREVEIEQAAAFQDVVVRRRVPDGR